MEPAASVVGMVIAAASALLDEGITYQHAMHATLIDIDATACHMAYVRLSLLHVPAIVIHGNALVSDTVWGQWVTPTHVLGLWDMRLRRRTSANVSANRRSVNQASDHQRKKEGALDEALFERFKAI